MNGSFLIPASFHLNKKKIEVIVDDDYCKEENLWGEADFTLGIITLCHRTNKGKVLSKIDKEKTFFHELIHQILNSMEEEDLSYNEQFVDKFSLLLYEYEKSKK